MSFSLLLLIKVIIKFPKRLTFGDKSKILRPILVNFILHLLNYVLAEIIFTRLLS